MLCIVAAFQLPRNHGIMSKLSGLLMSTSTLFTLLDRTSRLAAWLGALLSTCAVLACLWLTRYQPIEMDLAMMQYSAYLINEKNFLLYRDIFENNFPGPFFFHAMIGNTLGYGALPIRFLDAAILLGLAVCSWKILAPLSRVSAVFAPALFSILYFAGGTTAAFQRDYIAVLPIAAALALLCRTQLQPRRDALAIGALSAIACSFKPNFIVAAPALFWILCSRLPPENFVRRLQNTLPCAALGFLVVFSMPFIWGIHHADFSELIALYKTYTPVYVSTRPDLYHYDSREQQWLTLLSMQGDHLLKMAIFSVPGLLWSWRQHRHNPDLLIRLRGLALVTFAITWHEMIAGKYWFAHLLAPYFFAALCFSLLLTPVSSSAPWYEKSLQPLAIAAAFALTILIGSFTKSIVTSKHYTADNHDIRSKKIARYLTAHLQAGDRVQSLDGSGDGQGALLLANAVTATRFVEDIPLYLQPTAPATQAFRQEFLTALQTKPPRFFVYIHNFFHPAGGNRLKEFQALYEFLQKNYEIAEEEDGEYTIYRHREN